MLSRKKALLVGAKGKRKRASEPQDADDEEFDADMDDLEVPAQEDEDDPSDDETAAEKRLRIGTPNSAPTAQCTSLASASLLLCLNAEGPVFCVPVASLELRHPSITASQALLVTVTGSICSQSIHQQAPADC